MERAILRAAALRLLRGLQSFVENSALGADGDGEIMYGSYINSATDQFDFFEQHLCYRLRGQQICVPYVDIVSVELPAARRSRALLLMLQDGTVLRLTVTGRSAGMADRLQLMHFFSQMRQLLLAEQGAGDERENQVPAG